MTLFARGEPVRVYSIALGGNPVGHKQRRGDERTPEGVYFIESQNEHSRFHLALSISYPNEEDRERAAAKGVSPGGDIMIHGIRNGLGWLGPVHRLLDWTDGCIAVTNSEIEEIWKLVEVGTPVEITP